MVRNTVKPTSSKQPRKQRKARIKAPKNRRRKMMASPLSRELRERNEFYPRRLTVRKGDVVLVRRGGFEGHEGKVLDVDLKNMKVQVDGVVYQKADNTSIPKPIDPSNIEIIKLDLSDKRRKKKFERILEQSGLSEDEIRKAEEELDATESIEIAALETEDLDGESDEESLEDGPGEEVPEDGPAEEPAGEPMAEESAKPVEPEAEPASESDEEPTPEPTAGDTEPIESDATDDQSDNKEGSN